MKKIFMLLVVCVTMVFVSCSKDDDDNNGNGAIGNYGKDLVSKVTYEGEDGESLTVIFTYDKNGNLVKTISDWRYEHDRDNVIATYERSGNKVTEVDKYGDDYKQTYIYTLNDNGRILVIEEEGDEGDRVSTYTYNNVGELIQWERSDGSRDRYIWENGNMIKCIDIDDEEEHNYEYTGEENNMNIEVTQLIEGFDYAGYLGNKNLVKTEIYNNSSKYEYEYEIESGKVISIKQFHIQNGAKELYGTYHIYYN